MPLVTAVTRPADETVATEAAEEDHVTVAPDITDPAASFTVALNVTVSLIDTKVFVLGDTVTVAATWPNVIEAVALAEPDVAVIVADPAATEVTNPADETVAAEVLDDDHVTVAPDITDPAASFTVAVSVAVSPTDEKASEFGESVIVAATWVTVTEADLLAVPEVAVIVTDPEAIEVTNPADETVATAALVEDHVTVAPDIAVPPASFTVAVRVAVSPSDTKATEVGESVTLEAT